MVQKVLIMTTSKLPPEIDVSISRDLFLRKLVRELSGSLEEIIGLEEASGFISIVGQHLGEWMNQEYLGVLNTKSLSQDQVKDVLIDLKKRIGGDFYLISDDKEKIVLGNRRCPFGSKVLDRPSMCMMTSNVFGVVTAENLGYAKVSLEETIANGDKECLVVIYKIQNDQAEEAEGREYYKS